MISPTRRDRAGFFMDGFRVGWSGCLRAAMPRTGFKPPLRIMAFAKRHSNAPLACGRIMGYGGRVHWNDTFLELHHRCVSHYRAGNTDFESYYSKKDLRFLRGIGCREREFFDFVEDFCDDNTPTPATALLVAAVRRDYFLTVCDGVEWDGPLLTRDDIPSFGEALDDIAYLPRIIAKARAKLRGALDPDLMYGCGGDRNFLRKHGDLHPADFLRVVWDAGEDDSRIAGWVRGNTR